jgi:hypothetical protein
MTKSGKKQEKERNPDGTFPKGKSGNPKGRPKGKSLTNQLREALREIEANTGEQYDVLLVKRLLDKAISKGDMKAIQMIWERLEGKPTQQHEHSGLNGDPIAMKHEYEVMLAEIDNMDNLWAGVAEATDGEEFAFSEDDVEAEDEES